MMTYYEILNINSNATQKEIREAYVKQIKKYHPDVFPDKEEGNKQTQLINEAYATLKDAAKRFEYDNKLRLEGKTDTTYSFTSSDNHYNNSDNIQPEKVPHYECEICGKQDSTLRVTVFIYVISLLYVSWKKGWGKILCNKCRIKYALLWNLEVWFLGWWSIYGFFFSLDALFKNLQGGIQPKYNNHSLLSVLAYDFYLQGRYNEAYKAIKRSLEIKWTKEGTEFLKYLEQYIVTKESIPFKEKLFNYHPAFYTVPSLIVLFVLTMFLFFGGSKNSSKAFSINDFYDYGRTTNSYNYNTEHTTDNTFSPPENITPKKEFNIPEQPLPKNGEVKYYTTQSPIAPFKIETRYSDNYFIKLTDYYSNKTVMTIFIRGGMSVNVDVPLGTYNVKYAVGEKWYGQRYLFGPDTRCYKAESIFDFKMIGDQVSGYSLELYKQAYGNLQESRISNDSF